MPSQTFQPTEVNYKELYDDPDKKEKEKKEKEAKEKENMDSTSAPTSANFDHDGKAGEPGPEGAAALRPKGKPPAAPPST